MIIQGADHLYFLFVFSAGFEQGDHDQGHQWKTLPRHEDLLFRAQVFQEPRPPGAERPISNQDHQ